MKDKKPAGILNRFFIWLDGAPLWAFGFPLMMVLFSPYFVLKQGSVFPIHDQLDETLLTYVLNARHLFDGSDVFPELLGGISKSGMQPSAILFIPLYRLFPALYAFLIQYLIVCVCGFHGMYGSVKKLSGSSILALAVSGCFCMLPVQPVYGLSIMGVPLLLYAFLLLSEKKHVGAAYALILFFGLTTHLVLIGYVVLSFWLLDILIRLVRKEHNFHIYCGFALLTGVYLIVNYRLFTELLLGSGSYASHRDELVNTPMAFWPIVKDVFLHSAQHAESLHEHLILPIVLLLSGEGFYCLFMKKRKRLKPELGKLYRLALAGMAVLGGIAFFYAVCKSVPVTEFKNSVKGFLHYFQAERFYWLYPALWYLEFALVFAFLWKISGIAVWCKAAALVLLLLPTANLIKVNSYFYMNINQINNGSGITGYVSWESFYSEELMSQLENAIGKDMSEYRVAHLGISPAPSLMHGFCTADGYSNNYPLEYKHRFRQVIAGELSKNEEARVYFDCWGSRCYLFNSISGTYWMLPKDSGVQYENLAFDLDALKDLGCEYLFSGGEIVDAGEMGLRFLGYYDTEDSYFGIWLYELMP
ncbi:MAG TPA: hypothetical protein DCZ91_14550 [Lachnospiraceae bacterium]|nr:hypothetical protein [Lachnospiraceae bacterium]